ncbi:MAG: sulfatase-like hydrolase/transferase [Polyangiales bacterium]
MNALRLLPMLSVLAALSCGRDRALGPAADPAGSTVDPPRESQANNAVALDEPGAVDLLDPLRNGAIDVNGPVVDLGERQSAPFVLPPVPLRSGEVNGDSWAEVGTRLKLRVPIDASNPPDRVRLRVRRVRAHKVLVLVDGVPVRQALFPEDQGTHVIDLPVAPERFTRDVSMVELRFLGANKLEDDAPAAPRSARRLLLPPVISAEEAERGRDAGAPSVAQATPAQRPVLEIDWVHVCRADASVARVADLVSDVRIDRTPRRSLTLYAPTRASWVTVLPAAATLRTAVTAEGVRGANASPVRARIRVETDDAEPVEHTLIVRPNQRWEEVSLDLARFAHRAARISFATEVVTVDEDGGALWPARDDAGVTRADVRVAFADPRVIARTAAAPTLPPVRHALFVVVRGLRADRVIPQVNARLSHGGFSRLSREGLVAKVLVPSGRELPALASMLTGLTPEGHRMEDWTDTHDERAPTMGSLLREGGMATALFGDDKWIEGSGLDRGYGEVRTCPGEAVRCRAEVPLGLAAEWLVTQRDRRAFAVVVTRAGVPPFDPPRDLLLQLDPNPPENALQPEGTAQYALVPRGLESLNYERLATLYDAAMANVDRSLAQAMDRLRDAGLLEQTVIVVVGSRGSALGEDRWIGEGPVSFAVVSESAVMIRAPGVRARALTEVVDALDANATVLERLGVQGPWRGAFAPVSLSVVSPMGVHPRGFVSALGVHNDLALRFGDLLALTSRNGTNMVLVAPDQDPTAQTDLRSQRPIALTFAERTLAGFREAGGIDPERYQPSTRALSDAVVAALRQGTARH